MNFKQQNKERSNNGAEYDQNHIFHLKDIDHFTIIIIIFRPHLRQQIAQNLSRRPCFPLLTLFPQVVYLCLG